MAHPGLVALARKVFDEHMSMPNQLDRLREDVTVNASHLLEIPKGTRTEDGLRWNINVAIRYLESWLGGNGCVPLYHLMEDAATAEISRTQIWQWLRHGATLDDGRPVTPEMVDACIDEEMKRIRGQVGEQEFANGRFAKARELFRSLTVAPTLEDFLTLPAYAMLED